ncbi:MAG: ribulose-phosphate 3-epimerase [Holosporales bacterium]|jgi:ribulose-phosphate 3-epimerase|nr:ribulose-phosphate 3-epimerase [Holosporales bacterium]
MHISASLLSADPLNIAAEIAMLTDIGVDSLHVDIMDGHFVPNIAFGIDTVKCISENSLIPINVHLMVANPSQFIDMLVHRNVECVIIHREICGEIEEILKKIKTSGTKAGIAINPETEVCEIEAYMKLVDFVLIMGVSPGFSGQQLVTQTLNKVAKIKSIRNNVIVGIDGGINDKTAILANKEKVDILVAGSYLFDCATCNRVDTIKEKLRKLCQYR